MLHDSCFVFLKNAHDSNSKFFLSSALSPLKHARTHTINRLRLKR